MLATDGFTIIDDIFSEEEVREIIRHIELPNRQSENFRQSGGMFAIRQVFREIPALKPIVFNKVLQEIIRNTFGADYFLVKAIYFDKPALSNWFVSYHQDLSIAVDKKAAIDGFNNWTKKNNQYNVQPTKEILESVYTIRIHLDECTSENGALFVIPGSHKNGMSRALTDGFSIDQEICCEVKKGGIMIMRPLLWHASRKSTIDRNRRVLHLEFCNCQLPDPVEWAEKEKIN
jgi:ectoine hydroxylase-related dioxygenase (phytanoyl-CoA dioxygenase family)